MRKYGSFPIARELGVPEHLHRHVALERREVELGGLRRARDVRDAEDDVLVAAPDVREHLAVRHREELHRAAPERLEELAERDGVPHPVEQRRRVARLRLHVHRLVAVDGIRDRRGCRAGSGRRREKPALRSGGPLHRRPHAVAVVQVDVVAHADLVAVVDDRRAGEREEQAVQELHAPPAVLHERREAAPDAHVELHARVLAVREVHVVPLVVVTISSVSSSWLRRNSAHWQVSGIGGVRPHDLDDRLHVLEPERHEDARHEREVEGHVALVAVAEVRADVVGPLVRLGEQHPSGEALVHVAADLLDDRVRARAGSRSSSRRAR